MAMIPAPLTIAPATAEPGPRPGAAEAPDQARFGALLQSLRELATIDRDAPPVADADQLRSALQRADDSFTAAMELRRQLEAACRDRLRG